MSAATDNMPNEQLDTTTDKPAGSAPSQKPTDQSKNAWTPAWVYLMVLLSGIYLGIVFVKSEVATWQRVHKMFLFQEAHMYLIISLAIVVAGVSMLWIKRWKIPGLDGKPVEYEPKPYKPGIIFGGIAFGAGWALTGACPGPIYVQIGGGEWMALLTLAGALAGMFCFAFLKPKLP